MDIEKSVPYNPRAKGKQRRIYIASSWTNASDVQRLASILRLHGHEVFDFTDSENRPDGLENYVFDYREWCDYTNTDPDAVDWIEFLLWPPTEKAFASDKAGLDWADTVVLLLPSGRSSHLEAGYAVGQGKTLFIYGDLPLGEFDAMYLFATGCYKAESIERLLITLSKEGE